jgi:hypothetical protein
VSTMRIEEEEEEEERTTTTSLLGIKTVGLSL